MPAVIAAGPIVTGKAMSHVDPASVALSYRDRMVAVAQVLMPGRVRVNIDGFAGRFLPPPV